MAGIWLNKGELITELSEIVGFKTGLCLNFDRMSNFLKECEDYNTFKLNEKSIIRIRPEEYENLYLNLLKGTGYIPIDEKYNNFIFWSIAYEKNLKSEVEKHKFLQCFAKFNKYLELQLDKKVKNIDIVPFVMQYINDDLLFNFAKIIVGKFIFYQDISVWNRIRRVDWVNTIDLEDLFKSESLETYYGTFLDQRYIDYLSNNLDDIGLINWRKFEALTCEFFTRNGYYVEIGEGRDDNGVDARIWKEKEDKENPPLILVQCKRQKKKVGKMVVKSLWADVDYENAESGIVVTTSYIEKGAKEVCQARGYNIRFTEREGVQKWIEGMRTPYNGIISL